jgi:hypothetical protein
MNNEDNKKECEVPFWKDFAVLFKDFSLEFKPNCPYSAWNFSARLILISFFIGMIASVLGGLPALAVTLMFGIFTALAIIFTTVPKKYIEKEKGQEKGNKWDTYHKLPYIANVDPDSYLTPLSGPAIESFVNGGSTNGSVQPFIQHNPLGVVEIDAFPYSGPMLPDYTPPKARNLFMNVLLDEIKYNPGRPAAASVDNPIVKQSMDDYFRVQWFSDPTDVFGKNQSQRQFVTQPSTTVPNDQGAYADWLYKIPGKTCKEGGRYCLSGSDGGPIPWLNMDS